MTRLFVSAALPALLVHLAVAPATAQTGFRCPAAPAPVAGVGTLLPAGDPFDNLLGLQASVDALQRKGLSAGAIVETLAAAYCPRMDGALPDAQKSARLARFAARIAQFVYGNTPIDAILVDVPLAPAVLDAATRAARDSGLGLDAWIAKAVATAAKAP
jgi:hypothetical protein